jgi:protein gp37
MSGPRKPYDGLTKQTKAGPQWTGRVVLDEPTLRQPLSWKHPRRVFVNSMSDLFHESLSDEYISLVFAVMALCPQHTFQVLTKRAERMRAYLDEMSGDPEAYCFAWARESFQIRGHMNETWPLPNVWLGVSVESSPFLNRLDELALTPAAVRFVSLEPLLADVGSISRWVTRYGQGHTRIAGEDPLAGFTGVPLDWVIVGGESGPSARPCHLDWIRSIIEQCHAARVPVFCKQMGSVWARANRADSKGGDMSFWPEYFHRREFPNAARS